MENCPFTDDYLLQMVISHSHSKPRWRCLTSLSAGGVPFLPPGELPGLSRLPRLSGGDPRLPGRGLPKLPGLPRRISGRLGRSAAWQQKACSNPQTEPKAEHLEIQGKHHLHQRWETLSHLYFGDYNI